MGAVNGMSIFGSSGNGVGWTASGGGSVGVGSLSDTIGEPGGRSTGSPNGPTVVGRSVAMATHCLVGLPVVPGGQVHTGRFLLV